VRVTTDQAMVRDFIRRYPDSPYVADAKKRLEELVRVAQEREEQARLAAVEAKRQKTEAEAASAWNSIKNTTDPAELQKFIKRFPETSLALNEATQRLGALDREARERVARAQAEAAVARSAWDRIKGTTDAAEVENFIKLYPGTPTALTDAKQLLEVLDRRAKEREAKVRMEADAAQAWNRIKGTSDQAELRAFIKRFPDSPLALTDAAQHLAALERDAKDRAERAQAEAAEARAAWNNVKNTSDPAELRDFMKRYPDSPLAVRDAKLGIEQLERQAKERDAKARAEAEVAAAWNSTKDSRDPADFKSFIKRYPNSPFIADAKQRLAAIEPKPEVRTKPEVAAQPDIRTKPEVEKRHEIASPPPPKAKEKVATRPREERVEPRRQQRERPVERAERPAPRQQPAVRYEAVARPSGGGHSGTMSGVGF
jgi:outer membrane protein assembly factor BamD (BamD/ComL family)